MMPEIATLLQLPEGIGPGMALFFMACAAVTAMLTAALGAGGGASGIHLHCDGVTGLG